MATWREPSLGIELATYEPNENRPVGILVFPTGLFRGYQKFPSN